MIKPMGFLRKTPDGDPKKIAIEFRDEAGKAEVEAIDKSDKEQKDAAERAARLREIAQEMDNRK